MRASMVERDTALDLVDMLIDYHLMDAYASRSTSSLWDWFDSMHMENLGFTYASGATKAVFFHRDLHDWIIKVVLPDEQNNDYCRREWENYLAAEQAGLSQYFAATEYLTTVNGIAFYIQEKVFVDESVDSSIYDSASAERAARGEEIDEDALWDEVYDMEADERVELLYKNPKLTHFILSRHINDLHCGNFGMRGGEYVLIDYSGFGLQAFSRSEV